MTEQPDLNFLGRRLERVQSDVAAIRDEMHVSSAMQRRTDGLISTLIEEVRAVRDMLARLSDRMGKIDDRLGKMEDAR